MNRARRIAIVGAGSLAERLADHFRGAGDQVSLFGPDAIPLAIAPVDIALISAAHTPAPASVAAPGRSDLASAMLSLTYRPLQAAAAFKPALAAAGGQLVLLSSLTARLGGDDAGRDYLERPFRAAAHALWRCLSIEWASDGIGCRIIALDADGELALDELAATIAAPVPAGPVELTDINGNRLGW